jgi:hypothetical protein
MFCMGTANGMVPVIAGLTRNPLLYREVPAFAGMTCNTG